MVLQLCALVLGADVGPLLISKAACTGFREYWNEETESCADSCGSGFYEIDGEVKVCSACNKVTQFVTEEKYSGTRECAGACPDSAFEDVRIGDIKYRQCIKKNSCANYV